MLTTTRMKATSNIGAKKLSQLSFVLLKYKSICDTCRLRNRTLPIMCKGKYDFLDDFCRTENRQENLMCKHGFTSWSENPHVLDITVFRIVIVLMNNTGGFYLLMS